jgi:DNA-binding IclR family transcriptional regulator
LTPKITKARGIQSLETGLGLLSAIADSGGPVALSVLSRRVGMPPGQVHRYLASLIAAGVVKQHLTNGLYDLDAGAMRLGFAALARLDIFREAEAVFAALTRTTRHTSLLSIWGEHGPTIIRWYPGDPPVITPLHIGSTLPLLQSAIGRVFFTFGHRPTMDRAAKREQTRTRIRLPTAQLRRDVAAARGAAIDSTMIPGLYAAAAPIFDLQGSLAMVGASVMLAASGTDAMDVQMRADLHWACQSATQAIGGRWFD